MRCAYHERIRAVRDRIALKRSTITHSTIEHSRLCRNQLNHLSNSHTRREAVWVHNNIRADALISKGEILLRHDTTDDALLAVSR